MSTNALDGRVAVVTGATGGMGQVIAVELTRLGAHVVTVARNPQRADQLRARITDAAGIGSLEVIDGDLSRRADVHHAAQMIADRHPAVHLLVHNAGAHFPTHQLSPDGVEMHIALDYLAAYGLTALLTDALRRGRARVISCRGPDVDRRSHCGVEVRPPWRELCLPRLVALAATGMRLVAIPALSRRCGPSWVVCSVVSVGASGRYPAGVYVASGRLSRMTPMPIEF